MMHRITETAPVIAQAIAEDHEVDADLIEQYAAAIERTAALVEQIHGAMSKKRHASRGEAPIEDAYVVTDMMRAGVAAARHEVTFIREAVERLDEAVEVVEAHKVAVGDQIRAFPGQPWRTVAEVKVEVGRHGGTVIAHTDGTKDTVGHGYRYERVQGVTA